MDNKIALPDRITIEECDLCFRRVNDTMFEATCPKMRYLKGVLCYNGKNYIYDTQDKDGISMTFVFSNLERLFKFLIAHKDGNYTNLT